RTHPDVVRAREGIEELRGVRAGQGLAGLERSTGTHESRVELIVDQRHAPAGPGLETIGAAGRIVRAPLPYVPGDVEEPEGIRPVTADEVRAGRGACRDDRLGQAKALFEVARPPKSRRASASRVAELELRRKRVAELLAELERVEVGDAADRGGPFPVGLRIAARRVPHHTLPLVPGDLVLRDEDGSDVDCERAQSVGFRFFVRHPGQVRELDRASREEYEDDSPSREASKSIRIVACAGDLTSGAKIDELEQARDRVSAEGDEGEIGLDPHRGVGAVGIRVLERLDDLVPLDLERRVELAQRLENLREAIVDARRPRLIKEARGVLQAALDRAHSRFLLARELFVELGDEGEVLGELALELARGLEAVLRGRERR